MMIEPPIESLLKNTNNNKYKLCILAEKRAKEIASKRFFEGVETPVDKKEITQALEEIETGIIIPSEE